MQRSPFDLEGHYARLSKAVAPLERLDAASLTGQYFVPFLPASTARNASRLPCAHIHVLQRRDPVGKPLTMQRLHSLSDKRLQYQVRDRLYFMHFLGLELSCNMRGYAHGMRVPRSPQGKRARGYAV